MNWFKRLVGDTDAHKPVWDTTERRRTYRVQFDFGCLLVVPPFAAMPCTVINVSNHGMRLILLQPVKRHTEVKLVLQGHSSPEAAVEVMELKARVAWCRRHSDDALYGAGVEFGEAHADIMPQLAEFLHRHNKVELPSDTTQRRRRRRIERAFPVRQRLADGSYCEGMTRDIGDTMIRFDTPEPAPVGSTLEVFLIIDNPHDPVLLTGKVERCTATDEGRHDILLHIGEVIESDRHRLERLLHLPTAEKAEATSGEES